jgi:raffinose/stachyose/melibiose transport system substrate-binding protein
MTKKWIYCLFAVLAVAALAVTIVLTQPSQPNDPTAPSTTAPTQPPTSPTPPTTSGPVSDVRLYQCDAGRAAIWQELAKAYTEATGIPVTILTPEDHDCTGTPLSALTGPNSATIFCLHHTHELQDRQAYCLDLSGTEIAGQLQQDIFALKNGEAIAGVAFNVESYGIIYNSLLLADAGYTQSDIRDFKSLSDVVLDITANKRKLGFSAFAAPDLSTTDHGALLCLLAGLTDDETALRAFWDLYRENATRTGTKLTQATRKDALSDFLGGKAVFYLGGSWDYESLTEIEDYYLGFMPVFSGEAQDNLGLYHSNTGYWCVNSHADEMDIQASLDFLNWLVTATEESAAPADRLEYLMPFRATDFAGNPLEKLVLSSMKSSQNNISWTSCDTLTPEILRKFGDALIAYTKNPTDEKWAELIALQPGLNHKNPEA